MGVAANDVVALYAKNADEPIAILMDAFRSRRAHAGIGAEGANG